MKKKLHTLEEASNLYILLVYTACKFNKASAAEVLGIGYKTFLKRINNINEDFNLDIVKKQPKCARIFPTNEERIRYRDEMLNRDSLG